MTILSLGLSHHTAPIALREQLGNSHEALKANPARFGFDGLARPAALQELVILATCHRLELYAVAHGEDFDSLVSLLAETSGLAPAEFGDYLYRHTDGAAVRHLCSVAAGLDSLVLGESQILGQVTEAYSAALGQSTAGPVLSAMFRAAILAGKRARSETGISRNPASLSSVAVRLAADNVGDLASARVLVVGAGEMARLAVAALRARGAFQTYGATPGRVAPAEPSLRKGRRHGSREEPGSRLTVVSRTRENARQLAYTYGGRALPFERLSTALAWADLVISATSAPHVVISAGMVRAALAGRPERPLVLVDIALPRDVDPTVCDLPNVRYYHLDHLNAQLDHGLSEREREVPQVESIVAEETASFMHWLRGLEVTPLVAALRARADALRRAELEKTLRHLAHLDPADRQRIEAFSEALLNKWLHEPTRRLKDAASSGHGVQAAAALRELFGL